MKTMKWNYGRLLLGLLVMATVLVVMNYPALIAGGVALIGWHLDPEVLCHAGYAMGIVAALPELEFQTKMLDGVDGLTKVQQEHKAAIEKVNLEVDRWDKSTKETAEELTKLKKTANDQQANMDAFIQKMGEFQRKMVLERASILGDPIARISGDEELRTRLNCAVRLAMDKNGDMRALVAPQLKALGITFNDLLEKHAARMSTKAGLGEDASPGSLLINDQLSKEIYSTLPNYGIWSTLGVQPLGTKSTKFTVDTADPVCLILLTEAEPGTDDANITGTQVTATAEIFMVLLNVSLQLIQDSEIDLTSFVMKKFARAYTKRLDHVGFAADGTADVTHGGFTGLFNFGTAAAAGAGNTTIQRLTLDDFIRCLTTVDAEVLNGQPKWWTHPYNLALALTIKDANGRSIFLTSIEAPTRQGIGSILGSPVILGNVCPSTNAASAKTFAFGDGESMVMGIRSDYSFDSSDHHKWANLQRSFRGWGRAAVKGRLATALAVLTNAAN